MTCPLLEYRRAADGRSFTEARAYCTGAERFVQAMRADICNDRYGLEHAEDCEIYLEHAADDDGSLGADDGAVGGDSEGDEA